MTNSDKSTTSMAAVSALPSHLLQSHILSALDGRSLASLSSVSRNWRTICQDDVLWKSICTSLWPSLAGKSLSGLNSGYRSLYSDCITTPCAPLKQYGWKRSTAVDVNIPMIISAVDIYYDGQVLCSKDFSTGTTSDAFLNSPFKLQALSPKDKVPLPVKFDDEEEEFVGELESRLRVSWILINPSENRALNVTGFKPVDVSRHWVNGYIKLQYATVVLSPSGELTQCNVVVTCGGEHGGGTEVVDVSLQVEDLNLKGLSGFESLMAIGEAMAGRRRLSNGKVEKERHKQFVKRRVEKKEREEMIKRNMDVVIITTIVFMFAAIFSYLRS